MTYAEVREIVRDQILSEQNYEREIRRDADDRVARLERSLNALARHFGVYIETHDEARVIVDQPEARTGQFIGQFNPARKGSF